jgi:HEAT repeat protein
MKWAILVATVAVVGVAVWLAAFQDRAPRSAPPRPVGEVEAPPTAPGADRFSPADATALRAALASGRVQATRDAAAALRRELRTDAAARERVERLLLAGDTPPELRMALAFVLGTLGGSDPVLLEALRSFHGDEDLVRCLLHALGATRDPPDDDEVFGLGDRPWGVHGPGGLGITVRRHIDDPGVRQALAGSLSDGRGSVREAGARALRHSTANVSVRSAFLSTLRAEPTDDVATVLGEALAVWAGGAPSGAEQTAVVTTLLARAGEEGLDGYRFRMEDDFRRIPLDEAQQATLRGYAHPPHAYAVRSFALSALAAAAPAAACPVCEELLGRDTNAAVRDLAARLLGTLPGDGRTLEALIAASREDEAWHVRYQALDALRRFRTDEQAAAAIRAAIEDPDERVARRATELSR